MQEPKDPEAEESNKSEMLELIEVTQDSDIKEILNALADVLKQQGINVTPSEKNSLLDDQTPSSQDSLLREMAEEDNRPETEEDGIRAEALRRARVRHLAKQSQDKTKT